MRLFFEVDGKEVASVAANYPPRIGDKVWVKTTSVMVQLKVLDVEHQFDRSTADRYHSHDVLLTCATL